MTLLAEQLADPTTPMETRSACAIGLGLSRRTANLRPLHIVSKQIKPNEELLAGHLILGRALLGDNNIIEPAKRLLAGEPAKPSLSSTMARRAAALGLGVLGNREVLPVLTDAWHLSYYINREVLLALSLCDAQQLAAQIVAAMNATDVPSEKAYFAGVLGALTDAHRPSRLSRFTGNTNYTMKNKLRLPFQALGNEFLFDVLIPSFGKGWH